MADLEPRGRPAAPAGASADARAGARDTFLKSLAMRRSVAAAARAAGISCSTARRWRDRDPVFARAWAAALGMTAGMCVQRDHGVPKVMRARQHRWDDAAEAAFLAALAAGHTVTAASAAIGFNPKSVYKQRRKRPDFARAWDETLGEARDGLAMLLLACARTSLDAAEAADGAVEQRVDGMSRREAIDLLKVLYARDAYVRANQRGEEDEIDLGEVHAALEAQLAIVRLRAGA